MTIWQRRLQRLAIGAVCAAATDDNPMGAAVGPDHTMLNLIPLAIPQRLLDGLVYAFAVIGMNRFNQIFEGEMVVRRPAKVRFYERAPHGLFGAWPVLGVHAFRPSLVAAVKSAGRQAVYRLGLFRPDDLIGLDSPFEAAEPSRLLSEVQSLLIYAERFTRPLLLVNVHDQVDAHHHLAPGVADRSAADTDPCIYPIAPMIKDLLAGYDFPLKRPPQHGFMTLDTSPVHIIGEPVSIRFDVRRQNQRVGENLFQCLWSQDYRSVPPTARRAYGRDNEWILRLGCGLRQRKKRWRGRLADPE